VFADVTSNVLGIVLYYLLYFTVSDVKTLFQDFSKSELSHFFVHHVKAKAGSSTLDLGDLVGNLLDALDLLVQVVGLKEVAEVGVIVAVSGGVEAQQGLVDGLLQLEGGFHGLQRGSPLHLLRLGDVKEDALSTTLGLVLHKLHSMIPLFIGLLLEVGSEPVEGLLVPVEPGAHGEIDVAGVELHVDLLVDEGLAVLVEVLPDLGSHLATWSLLVVVVVVVV